MTIQERLRQLNAAIGNIRNGDEGDSYTSTEEAYTITKDIANEIERLQGAANADAQRLMDAAEEAAELLRYTSHLDLDANDHLGQIDVVQSALTAAKQEIALLLQAQNYCEPELDQAREEIARLQAEATTATRAIAVRDRAMVILKLICLDYIPDAEDENSVVYARIAAALKAAMKGEMG